MIRRLRYPRASGIEPVLQQAALLHFLKGYADLAGYLRQGRSHGSLLPGIEHAEIIYRIVTWPLT